MQDQAKMQILDDEWRKLSVEPLPFDHKDMELEEFWGTLSDVKDGAGLLQFLTLCSFMSSLLSLPHANVDVERIFSSVNLIKTKNRNRLHTKTVHALLKTKDGIKAFKGCVEFIPPLELKRRMTTNNLYSADPDEESDSDEN